MAHSPKHRLKSSTRLDWLVVVPVLVVVALLASSVVVKAVKGWHASPPPAEPTPDSATVSKQHVDAVVAHTLAAASRLDAFGQAAASRRPVVLERAHDDLDTARQALDGVSDTTAVGAVQEAGTALNTLLGIVSGLEDCVADEGRAEERKKDTAGAKPSVTADQRTNKSARDNQKDEQACTVSAKDVESARAAGAAVGDLIPYGLLTDTELATLNLSVTSQATAEALKGSESSVVLPTRYVLDSVSPARS